MTAHHTPIPLSVGQLIREPFGNFLPIVYDEKMIACLVPVPYLSDPKYSQRAAHIVHCVNNFDALIEALNLGLEYWAHRQQRYKNRSPVWVQKARAAIANTKKVGS